MLKIKDVKFKIKQIKDDKFLINKMVFFEGPSEHELDERVYLTKEELKEICKFYHNIKEV